MGISERSIRELIRMLERGKVPTDSSALGDLWYCLRELLELRQRLKELKEAGSGDSK